MKKSKKVNKTTDTYTWCHESLGVGPEGCRSNELAGHQGGSWSWAGFGVVSSSGPQKHGKKYGKISSVVCIDYCSQRNNSQYVICHFAFSCPYFDYMILWLILLCCTFTHLAQLLHQISQVGCNGSPSSLNWARWWTSRSASNIPWKWESREKRTSRKSMKKQGCLIGWTLQS